MALVSHSHVMMVHMGTIVCPLYLTYHLLVLKKMIDLGYCRLQPNKIGWFMFTASQRSSGQTQVAQSTISRFSCRICVDRNAPYTARIYAAGFDQHNHIFLGVSQLVYVLFSLQSVLLHPQLIRLYLL